MFTAGHFLSAGVRQALWLTKTKLTPGLPPQLLALAESSANQIADQDERVQNAINHACFWETTEAEPKECNRYTHKRQKMSCQGARSSVRVSVRNNIYVIMCMYMYPIFLKHFARHGTATRRRQRDAASAHEFSFYLNF